MVFHRSFKTQSIELVQTNHVNCFLNFVVPFMSLVKVHRVFSSCRKNSASSRGIQFHWVLRWDSKATIKLFMRDTNYMPRNFATLKPLSLQPSLTKPSFWSFHFSCLVFGTGQVSDFILRLATLQSPVFLLNSSHFEFSVILIFLRHLLYRSNEVILPSSLTQILSIIYVHLYESTWVGWDGFIFCSFFMNKNKKLQCLF